jgi:hypothetical protein
VEVRGQLSDTTALIPEQEVMVNRGQAAGCNETQIPLSSSLQLNRHPK